MSWRKHPAVRTGKELTLGERAADVLRNGMGSWGFVFAFLGFMAVWMALNTVAALAHWDVYPFVLLNLCLSCLAGLQGAILLIAAKRADQVSAELANHNLEYTIRGEVFSKAIAENLGLDLDAIEATVQATLQAAVDAADDVRRDDAVGGM